MEPIKDAPEVKFVKDNHFASIEPTVFNERGDNRNCMAVVAAVYRSLRDGKQIYDADWTHSVQNPEKPGSVLGNPSYISFESEKGPLDWLAAAAGVKLGEPVRVSDFSLTSIRNTLGLNTNHAFIFDLSSTDTHLQQHTVFAHVTKYDEFIVYDGQSGARLKIDQLPALNGKFHRFID